MKKCKQFLSVLLAVVMLVCVVQIGISAFAVTTDELATYISGLIGTEAKEWGGGSGTQCVELPKYYLDNYFGFSIKNVAMGNGNEFYKNVVSKFPGTFDRIDYYNGFTPLPGDIISYHSSSSPDYGHAAIVYSVSGNQYSIAEQWKGSGTVRSKTVTVAAGVYGQSYTIIGVARPKTSSVSSPTDLSISINKGSFKVGETVTFTFSCNNAESVAIPIDYNGVREQFVWVSGNTYSMQLTKAGQYGFFLYARNAAGEAATPYDIFYVYDAAPNNMSIAINKKEFAVGETVNFTYSCSNADRVAIPIDYNGVREQFIEVNDGNYSMELTKAGQYGYFLYAENAQGEAATEYDIFYVYDSAPKDLEFSVNKTEFQVGETAIFSFSCVNAEEIAIPIDFNGVREQFFEVHGNTFTMELTKAGQYGAFLYAKNRFGEASTVNDYITFVVKCSTHTWNSGTVTTAASCTSTGVRTYTCTVCGATRTETINKTAHQTTIINAREATYDAEGYTGDTYCTACRQTLSYGTVIPKLTKPEDPTSPTQPTTQQQQQSGTCRYCGGTHTGFPGILIGFFHSILALFGLRK